MRTLNVSEVWSHLSAVGVIRDVSGGASNTLNAAASAGDTGLTLADTTGFTADDPIRIGDEENQEVAIIESVDSATALTLKSAISYDHESGEDVVEQVKARLGDVDDNGIDAEDQADRNQINASTRRERLGFLIGNCNQRISFGVENHSLENVMARRGIPESNITGAGSAADPSKASLRMDDWDTQANQSFYFTGALKNGTTVEVICSRTSVDPNGSTKYARGNPAILPFAVDIGHVDIYSPAL